MNHLPAGAVAQRRTNPTKWIDIVLHVRRRKTLPDLSDLDLVPPNKRKYMSREELETSYGSAPDAVAKVEEFAKKHGLTVTQNIPGAATIKLGGSVAKMTAAFNKPLFDYTHPTLGEFHASPQPDEIPQELEGAITGFTGFNNQRHLRRRRVQSGTSSAKTTARGLNPWFLPTDLATIYNFPQTNAANQCIGILEFGGGIEESDITAYFDKIGVPAPKVATIEVDGVLQNPQSDPTSTEEVMLDIEVAGALGGGASIAVYFSTFDQKGLIDALNAVIADKTNSPSVLSVSWGWDENQPFGNNGIIWSPSAIEQVNESLLAVAHLGISVCISTGDDGSEAQIQDGVAHVNFPATSPYVLAVGGTTLHASNNGNGLARAAETVWNDGPGSGTGGGVSDVTPVPDWQKGLVPASINPGGFAGRAIPDVSADADPATGYFVRSGGKFTVVGGTSAAAPLWAALIARINAQIGAPVGNFNALLYSQFGPNQVLFDITEGNNDTDGLLNGQFPAGQGWDACTGWGSPDGVKLMNAFKNLAAPSVAAVAEGATSKKKSH
ncbi:MAG: S8 family serine peptidase [Verrucomicrobia bacterium]|nr:S8 family serine peptidase [Verrucomicrobiota bacterium]